MDMDGYFVCRYRNIYFYFYHSGCDPRSLGISILTSMRQPDSIKISKKWLEEKLDQLKPLSYPFTTDDLTVSRTHLEFCECDVQFVYEIDLDRNIFHINQIPFFNLECLPKDEVFLEYVTWEGNEFEHRNNYDNFSCTPGFPPCHKYKRPALPAAADSELATYQFSVCVGTHMALSDLLVISEILSPIERVRVSLLEIMIGQCMCSQFVTRLFYHLELATNHTQLTNDEWSFALSMANFAFVPQIFDIESRFICPPQPLKRTEFTWIREHTVLCIATYLDDEQGLRTSVSRLINAILEEKDGPGVYFGVAFSLQHCAIVKVVKDEHATMFSHTDALQFLPSFYGDSPSTPGIVALARLAYHVDPAFFVHVSAVSRWHEPNTYERRWVTDREKSLPREAVDVPLSVSCPVLPLELWREIALHLHVRDLFTFGSVSRVCRKAASMVLCYPHVCAFRLVATKEKPQCPTRRIPYQHLVSAEFYAVRDDIPANVSIAPWGDNKIEIPLRMHSRTRFSKI